MRFTQWLPGALLAAALAAPAPGQSLLVNSTFDHDVSGWDKWGASQLAWSSADARGSSSSGSIVVTNSGTIESESQGIEQCVALEAGKTYVLSGRARIASGQSATGYARGFMQLKDAAGCRGNGIPFEGGLPFDAKVFDAWTYLAFPVTAPANAKSGLVVAFVVKDQATGTLSASFDDLSLTAGGPVTLTVPASASIHGAAGAFFHTDLWLVNTSHTNSLPVTASFRCLTATPCAPATKDLTLQPRQTVRYADVLATLFERPEKAGPIDLTYDSLVGSLAVSSRTYTPDLPSPTNGTGIPAFGAADARKLTIIPGLASNGGNLTSGFRSNAGVVNPSADAVTVKLTLYEQGSPALGTPFTQTWQPHEAIQINDVFAQLGAGGVVTLNAYLVVEATAPVFSYATVIDNRTGDSVFLAGSGDETAP